MKLLAFRGSDRRRWCAKKVARGSVALGTSAWHLLTLRPLRRHQPVRVLTYHRFGNEPFDPFCLRPLEFERQMSWLASSGRAVSLAQMEAFLAGRGASCAGGLVVTLDDGDESVYTHALPVLKRQRIPAILFVIAGNLGRPGFLSLDQIRTVAKAGIKIGSHTMTHPNLTQLDSGAARDELEQSKRRLEEQLGCEVEAFAYPYGTRQSLDRRTVALVARAGYRWAFTSQHGPLRPGMDPMLLPRVKVEGGDPSWVFRLLCRGGLDPWIWVDRLLWRVQKPVFRRPVERPAASTTILAPRD